MATIFSRIIAGEIPSYKVAENEDYYAFLDINPLTKGHTLVVPKKEVDYIFDLDDRTLAGMMLFAKEVAAKIKREIALSLALPFSKISEIKRPPMPAITMVSI